MVYAQLVLVQPRLHLRRHPARPAARGRRRRRPSAAARRAGRRRPSWPSADRTGRARAARRRASRHARRSPATGRSAPAPSRSGRCRWGSSAPARPGAARRSCRPCPGRPRRRAPSAAKAWSSTGRRRVEKTAASKSLPRISVISGTPSQAAKTGAGHDRPRAAEGHDVRDAPRRGSACKRAPRAVERVRRIVLDRALQVAPAGLGLDRPRPARRAPAARSAARRRARRDGAARARSGRTTAPSRRGWAGRSRSATARARRLRSPRSRRRRRHRDRRRRRTSGSRCRSSRGRTCPTTPASSRWSGTSSSGSGRRRASDRRPSARPPRAWRRTRRTIAPSVRC